MQLDLRITGCQALTMDPERPTASVIGVWAGRIVGLDEDVAGLPAARTIDLGGATVLPGFVDAHTHLTWTGVASQLVDLSACRSKDAVLEAVAGAAAATPDGRWVDLAGYDQRPLGGHLTWQDLETVVPGRKVFITHVSGHACLVSRAVLDLISDDEYAGAAPGVETAGDGRPTGLFTEDAMALPRAVRLPLSVQEIVDAIETAGRQCLAQGVTTCADAGIATGLAGFSPVELAAYQYALEQGRLPVRVQVMPPATMLRESGAAPEDGIARSIDLGMRTGLGSARLAIGATKLWLDGGMSARTAAVSEPYAGDAGLGQLTYSDAELTSLVSDAHRAGWQLALHAIGDRAIDQAINAVMAAQTADPRPDARHRIEHAGLVRPDQLQRMAAAGLTAVVQPTFLRVFGDDYHRLVGERRSKWLYRGRSFLDHGIGLAGSSDRPVSDGAPLRAIQQMVQRTSSGGVPIGADESVTVDEALAAYTTGSAYACRMEDQVGVLKPGMCADLVVLGDDPRHVEAASLADVPVVATFLDGELVHGSP
ncbi:amidohydrolase [Phytoactinopolyspora mesophila]|uniref:Amidohydrolase family protein n=1 Tax=Phytoactinopolyspora mesophila TaxID=2650750 RepID=A0A7K3M7H2_9ACTN|nr:amidohydrolase [Phytoactinopolyspora mesophila]NDL59236.1 amidohydrolase family protein [Phytoactinopolyspora mesophila]